jgi:hypothetical protein
MSVGQQITNKLHPDDSTCRKWALLLRMRSLHLCELFTFMHWSSFSEREQTPGSVQAGADFFHFLFSENLAVWFGSSLPTKVPVRLNLYTTIWIVFYLEKYILKCMLESSSCFSHEHSFQCANSHTTFRKMKQYSSSNLGLRPTGTYSTTSLHGSCTTTYLMIPNRNCMYGGCWPVDIATSPSSRGKVDRSVFSSRRTGRTISGKLAGDLL